MEKNDLTKILMQVIKFFIKILFNPTLDSGRLATTRVICYYKVNIFYLTRAVIDNFIIVSWLSLGKI